eukprot:9465770-Pyramimonas_sp.AAC.1
MGAADTCEQDRTGQGADNRPGGRPPKVHGGGAGAPKHIGSMMTESERTHYIAPTLQTRPVTTDCGY